MPFAIGNSAASGWPAITFSGKAHAPIALERFALGHVGGGSPSHDRLPDAPLPEGRRKAR